MATDTDRYWDLLAEHEAGQHVYVTFLGLRSFETPQLLRRINEGLSWAAFDRFRTNLAVSADELAQLVQISKRTLSRRKERGRFEADESDRLVRLSRIFGRAVELHEGDAESARGWLGQKQPALGGARPLDLLRSEVGAREVETLIGRLEHGVFV